MGSLRRAALALAWISGVAGAGEPGRIESAWAEPALIEPALIENVGQWPDHVLFARAGAGGGAWLTASGLWVARREAGRAACVELVFERAGRPVRLRPTGRWPLDPERRYFLGSGDEPRVARCYRAVRSGLAPGVDLVVRATREGVAYDLELAAGASAAGATARAALSACACGGSARGASGSSSSGAIRRAPR
jgi:hypothetical protein